MSEASKFIKKNKGYISGKLKKGISENNDFIWKMVERKIMSIRSNWVEYDKDTRKYIKKRDNERCIICQKKGALQIMHIFLSRAKGGKGCKENGCLGCINCHSIIDNPIGKNQNELSKKYLDYCKKYLIEKENILKKYKDEKDLIETLLKFKNKPIELKTFDVNNINILEKSKRCRECTYLKKNKYNNNSINSYFCTKQKKILGKNNKICKNYKENK